MEYKNTCVACGSPCGYTGLMESADCSNPNCRYAEQLKRHPEYNYAECATCKKVVESCGCEPQDARYVYPGDPEHSCTEPKSKPLSENLLHAAGTCILHESVPFSQTTALDATSQKFIDALLGDWRFTHEGQDWMTVTFSRTNSNVCASGSIRAEVRDFAERPGWNGKWAQFCIVGIAASPWDGRITLFGRFLDGHDFATITREPITNSIELRLRLKRNGTIEGCVNGPTYSRPYSVAGVRSSVRKTESSITFLGVECQRHSTSASGASSHFKGKLGNWTITCYECRDDSEWLVYVRNERLRDTRSWRGPSLREIEEDALGYFNKQKSDLDLLLNSETAARLNVVERIGGTIEPVEAPDCAARFAVSLPRLVSQLQNKIPFSNSVRDIESLALSVPGVRGVSICNDMHDEISVIVHTSYFSDLRDEARIVDQLEKVFRDYIPVTIKFKLNIQEKRR